MTLIVNLCLLPSPVNLDTKSPTWRQASSKILTLTPYTNINPNPNFSLVHI